MANTISGGILPTPKPNPTSTPTIPTGGISIGYVAPSAPTPKEIGYTGLGESQYDVGQKFTESNIDQLNEIRAAKQTALDKLGNGLVNMGTSAFTGAVESTVGAVYGITAALTNQDASKLWKNKFTDEFIDPINESIKKSNPFYYSKKEQDASVLGGMLYQNFWFDKALGGAGYTVGSLAAGYGLNALFGLSKATAAGKLLSEAGSAEEYLSTGLQGAAKIADRIDMGKQLLMGGIMAHGEAALEARQTYDDAIKNGLTEKQALDAANTNYITNLAITGPTDMLLLGKWINPGTKQAAIEYNKITKVIGEAGEVTFKDATLDNAKRGYLNAGKKFLEGFVTEGGQEGLQYASNIGSQAFVKNYQIKNINWLSSLVDGMAEGLGHAITDKEGLENILVGGVTGGPFSIKGARSERLAREAATQSRIKSLSADPEFLQGGSKMANYILANNALNASEKAKMNNDLFEANNQEAYAFGKYVQAHIQGNTVDLLKAKLSSLKQAPADEFNKFFGFKEEDNTSQEETINKLIKRIDRLNDLHNNITRVHGIAQGTPEEIAENQWLKNAIFEASFTLDNKEERESKMAEELNNLTRNPALEVARKNVISAYKTSDTQIIEDAVKEWEKLTTQSLNGNTKLKVKPTYEEFRKTQRETYRKEYNDLVNKVLEDNPVIADDITQLLTDLNKNAEEREQVIKYLNALRNSEARTKIKSQIDKAIFKQIAQSIKEANLAAAAQQKEPVTSEEEAANIFPSTPEIKQKFVETPGGEQVDIGNMTNEQLTLSREAVIEEMNKLDPESKEFEAKRVYATALEEELNLRTNGEAILKNLRDRYRAATTLEEKKRIIEEAASKGFPINLDKYEADKTKHEAKQQAPANKEQVKSIDEQFSSLFKGTGEFQEVVIYSKGEQGIIANEAFNNLKEDSDFKNRLTLEVQKDVNPAGPIAYGSSEATQHPTLGKQRSNYNVIIKYAGTPIGFITFYNTFVNKQTGKTVDIANLSLVEFKQLFSKNATAADLAAFKASHNNAMMFHNYITSDAIMKKANYAQVSVGDLLKFINPYLTSGSIAKVQEDEAFVPLSEFTLHRNEKGEATIVDTGDTHLSTLNNGGVETYKTSNSTAYKYSENNNGEVEAPNVVPELVEAFTELSRLKKEKKAYSRYWALVEDTGGTIKVGDKKFRWAPLSPSSPYSKTDELMSALNNALDNDPGSPEARGEVKKVLNDGLFIAFGDNGNYASNFRVDIQPDYGFTTKEGKEIPQGYTLQIFSPTFFRNKEASGELNGVKWSIKNNSILYLKVTGRVDSFDTLIDKFEATRAALAENGGPLVGTTVISGSSFKNNPVTKTERITKVQDLESKLSSTTKVKRDNQKLVFGFNEKELIAVTPVIPKQPVQSSTTTTSTTTPTPTQELAEIMALAQSIPGAATTSSSTNTQPTTKSEQEIAELLAFAGGIPTTPTTQEDVDQITLLFGPVSTIESRMAAAIENSNAEMAEAGQESNAANQAMGGSTTNTRAAIERRNNEKIEALDKAQGYRSRSDQIERIKIQEEYLAELTALEKAKQKELKAELEAEPIDEEDAKLQQQNIIQINALYDLDQEPPDLPGFSRTDTSLTPEEQINLKQAFEELRKILPSWISIEELNALENNISKGITTLGYFQNNIVKLARIATVGTEYHEAFHAVFRTMLSSSEQRVQYDIAKEELRAELKKKEISYNDHKKEYLRLTPEAKAFNESVVDLLILEEYMADKFKDYMNKQKTTSKLRKFFDKILRFIGLVKTNEMDKLFAKIETGGFKNATKVTSRFDTPIFKGAPANNSIFLRNEIKEGKPIPVYLNTALQTNEVNKITGIVLTIIDNQLKETDNQDEELDIFNTDAVSDIVDKILNEYATTYFSPALTYPNGELTVLGHLKNNGNINAIKKYEDLMFLYNNVHSKKAFKEEIFKNLNKFNIDESSDFSINDSEISDTSPERNYDKNQEQVGGFGSLSKFMRRYIATTTYEVSLNDFFGTTIKELESSSIMVAVDPNKVYNALTKACQNQADINNVLHILADQLENEGEAMHFISKFFQDVNISRTPDGLADLSGVTPDNESLVQRVAKAFNLWSVNYKFGSFDPNGKLAEVIDSNRRDVDKIQVQTWASNFKIGIKNRAATNLAIAEAAQAGIERAIYELEESLDSISEVTLLEKAKTIQRNLRAAGMELSIGYIKHLILSNPDIKTRTDKQINKVNLYETKVPFKQVIKNLEYISSELKKSTATELVNPYERVVGKTKSEERGAVTRAEEIAKDNAIFDESVTPSTFVNAEGKTIYGLQTDTYHIRKIFEIATSEDWSLEKLQQKAIEDPTYKYLLNNFLLNSENFNAIKQSIRVERIDGLRERAIEYNAESKENKIGINKRQTEGSTYGSFSPREYAMLPYMLYATKDVEFVNGKPISLKPVLITVMEASNTADVAKLPIVQTINPETLKIEDVFLEAIFKQLESEHARIKAYEKGEFKKNILNFNYGKTKRAAEFWADAKVILESIYGDNDAGRAKIDELTKAESLDSFKAELKEGIAKWAMEEVDQHIEELLALGILDKTTEGNLNNVLLPKGFSELLADGDPNKLFIGKVDLRSNIAQVYLSNMINTLSINQLISGDPALSLKDYTDKFKRDKGANASGGNSSRVSFPSRPATQLKYGVYITKDFDEIKSNKYALGPTKIVPIYKEGTTEYTDEFKELEKDLTPDQLVEAKKNGKIAVADGQGHGTVSLFREIYDSLGRMTPELHKIFDKIEAGKSISPNEHKKLADNQVMLNSLKMVYYNGSEYLKLSIAPLTKEATSYKDKNGNWVAQKGLEWYHDMREKMEGAGIHLLGPPSMSKKMIVNPIMLDDNNNLPQVEAIRNGATIIDPSCFKLQQENPSNKLQIKDPTQMLQILEAEQNSATKITLLNGVEVTIGDLRNHYNNVLGYRIEEAGKIAKAFITELKGEVAKGKPTIKLKRLISIFREVAAQSGASEKLLSVLELDQNGDPLYDINLPDVVTKFEEMFNAHFNKVFSQKVPGYKTTLQSGHNHNIIYEKATGKIINRAQYLADPEAYAGDNYGTRELAYDQPRIVNGKEVGRYAEIIIPFHFAEQFGLKPGDAIPEEIAYLFGVRIPSQDKHSAMSLKIVDILPPHYGSNAIFPKELILLTGSDFDIDSFYIHRPDHYIKVTEDGISKFMLYGNTEDSAFDQHISWHSKNNVFVKSVSNIIKKSDSPVSIAYKEAKEALRLKKAEIKEKYKEKKELTDAIEYGVSTKKGFIIPVITNKIKAREVGRDIAEVKKELDALSEKLSNAEEAIALQAMRELRIPTTEEEFKKAKPKNPGALNNELLEMKIALHTNSHINNEIAKTPATLRAVQDEVLPKLLTFLGYNTDGSNYGRKSTTFSITGMLKSFVANKSGSAAIGAAVNATQAYSIFSKYGLPKIQPIIYDKEGNPLRKPFIEIDGVKLDGVKNNTFLNKEGKEGKAVIRRIMDTLSTLTSCMTDNAKWLFNNKMNVDLETLSVITHGVQQGVPLSHMTYLINNEYVNRYIKLSKVNTIQSIKDGKSEEERNAEARAALFTELEEKIKKEDPNIDLDALKREPITYQDLTSFLKYSSLSKNYLNAKNKDQFYTIIEQGPEGEDFLKSQYKLLHAYKQINEDQVFMNAFNSIIKLTKGVIGVENDRSFSADDDLIRNLKTLNIAVSRGENGKYYFTHASSNAVEMGIIPFDVLPIIQQDALIKANLTEFFDKQEISKEVFLAKTNLAREVNTIVASNIDQWGKSIIKRKTLRAFRRNFESFFNTLAFKQWWNTNKATPFPRLDSMLFKDLEENQLSLQDQITDFVKKNPQFKSNLFFRLIKGDINPNTSFENLTSNTRSKNNPGFITDVLNDYDAILNHNEDGYNLANTLFLYQMARYGLQYKNDSFVGIIATNRFRIIANNIKEMIPLFNNMDADKFKDLFGTTKQKAMLSFMRRFFTDVNNSKAIRILYPKSIKNFSYIDPNTNNLVFPRSSQLINVQTNALLTTAEQTERRNARHDYLGAVEVIDKKTGERTRSTAFPFSVKIKTGKGSYTLYQLSSLNGVAIEDVDLLGFPKSNEGKFNGHSATYIPVNYTGSNIANNAFLPYSLSDEELVNVTQHIQSTVGKDATTNTTTTADNINEFDDAEINAMNDTDVLSSLGLGAYADEAFASSIQPSNNVEIVDRYTDADVKANQNKIYVFGDNVQRVGTGGQAQIRNNPNAMGIATKLAPSMADSAFMSDRDLATNKAIIDSDIAKIKATGKTVVFPKDGLGTGLAKLQEKAPQTYEYLTQRLLQEFGFNNDTGSLQRASSKTLENAKPNPAVNVTTTPVEKSVLNIAELKSKLLTDALFNYQDAALIKRVGDINSMTDSQLIEEFNKTLKC